MEQKYTKKEIAEHLLDRALTLFLDDKDYLSALHLAGAAEEILGGILKSEGHRNALRWNEALAMDALESYRKFFANLITSQAGVRSSNPALVRAFAVIRREQFLGPGPWKVFTLQGYLETPSSDPALLYQDITVALKEASRINNGQPSLHALCLGALQISSGRHGPRTLIEGPMVLSSVHQWRHFHDLFEMPREVTLICKSSF